VPVKIIIQELMSLNYRRSWFRKSNRKTKNCAKRSKNGKTGKLVARIVTQKVVKKLKTPPSRINRRWGSWRNIRNLKS